MYVAIKEIAGPTSETSYQIGDTVTNPSQRMIELALVELKNECEILIDDSSNIETENESVGDELNIETENESVGDELNIENESVGDELNIENESVGDELNIEKNTIKKPKKTKKPK